MQKRGNRAVRTYLIHHRRRNNLRLFVALENMADDLGIADDLLRLPALYGIVTISVEKYQKKGETVKIL